MNEIVKSVSIENMVNQRAAVAAMLSQAHKLIREAAQLASTAHMGQMSKIFEPARYGGNINFAAEDGPAKAMKQLDAEGWKYLMNESGMRSLMDSKARAEWDTSIHDGKYPELTQANIEATFAQLFGARADMFERGVLEVFRRLSWDYKTNQPFKFGKRIIVTRLLWISGTAKEPCRHVNSSTTNELDDLVRVFSILDGKPEPDHRDGMYMHVSNAMSTGAWHCETEYFHLTWYKKGTGHLTFKRPDLVEKMNKIIAKHYPNALACEK